MADLGWEVKGDREAGLSLTEQVSEATVGLSGAPESGVLPDGPRPAAVHLRIDATGEGILARRRHLLRGVGRPIDRLQREPAIGGRPGRRFRRWLRRRAGHPPPRTRSG